MCGCPKKASRTTDTNLDCAFVEKALVFVVLKIGGDRALLPPSFYDPLLYRVAIFAYLCVIVVVEGRVEVVVVHVYVFTTNPSKVVGVKVVQFLKKVITSF